jgi:hypothetical protein
LIYVYYDAQFAFKYYAPIYGFESDDYIVGIASRQNLENYIQDLNELHGSNRVWILFSHVYNWGRIDEEAFLLEYLDRIGTKLDEFKAPGASVYLYDLEIRCHDP